MLNVKISEWNVFDKSVKHTGSPSFVLKTVLLPNFLYTLKVACHIHRKILLRLRRALDPRHHSKKNLVSFINSNFSLRSPYTWLHVPEHPIWFYYCTACVYCVNISDPLTTRLPYFEKQFLSFAATVKKCFKYIA